MARWRRDTSVPTFYVSSTKVTVPYGAPSYTYYLVSYQEVHSFTSFFNRFAIVGIVPVLSLQYIFGGIWQDEDGTRRSPHFTWAHILIIFSCGTTGICKSLYKLLTKFLKNVQLLTFDWVKKKINVFQYTIIYNDKNNILRELIFWLFSPVVPQGFVFSCS
jgi:hypothetical protein